MNKFREARKKKAQRRAVNFAVKVAKAMDEIKSSHVFFIMQQAFGDISWDEVEEILNEVLKKKK